MYVTVPDKRKGIQSRKELTDFMSWLVLLKAFHWFLRISAQLGSIRHSKCSKIKQD